jgi:ParB-like chromosome segregation protein Spo0J
MKSASQKIENIATADLIPYARNSRTHSDEQVAQIMASIREFGFCNPVLIDAAGTIIAGHGRVMAATRMKLETVPCLRLSHLTEAQRRAYVIADNKLALNATWDSEMLSVELADLNLKGFDLSFLGFADYELDPLLAADWSPPAVEDMPDAGEQHGHKIGFTSEQWETVKAALKKCRDDNDRGNELTDGQCVELICQSYL